MAVSMKPRLVGVSSLKRATRVRSISSTEICLPMTSSISCGRPAAEALYHLTWARFDPILLRIERLVWCPT